MRKLSQPYLHIERVQVTSAHMLEEQGLMLNKAS
jgi:hypothetical protein